MNLPWFVSATEAVDPHQQGGSESLGFRIFSCLFHRRHGPFFRTRRARLYRMGTRRRRSPTDDSRISSDRPKAISVRTRYAFRVSSRRMKSVVHIHVLRFRPRRINSFVHGHELTFGFRKIRRVTHGSSFLLPSVRRCSTACRKEASTLGA